MLASADGGDPVGCAIQLLTWCGKLRPRASQHRALEAILEHIHLKTMIDPSLINVVKAKPNQSRQHITEDVI
jgi:hypothetical protein